MDNIKDWTSLPMPELLTRASCRKDWKRISADSSSNSPDDQISQGTEPNIHMGIYALRLIRDGGK